MYSSLSRTQCVPNPPPQVSYIPSQLGMKAHQGNNHEYDEHLLTYLSLYES